MRAVVGNHEQGARILFLCGERGAPVVVELDPAKPSDFSELPADVRDELEGRVEPLFPLAYDVGPDRRLLIDVREGPDPERPTADVVLADPDVIRLVMRDGELEEVRREPGVATPCPSAVVFLDFEKRAFEIAHVDGAQASEVAAALRAVLEDEVVWLRLEHEWSHVQGFDHDHDDDFEDDPEPPDWRDRDWSWWKPGDLVPHHDVAEEFDPPLRHEGKDYDAADLYCATPGCGCRDMLVTFYPVDSDEQVGAVDFDLGKDKVLGLRDAGEQRPLLEALWERWRASHPLRQIRERHREMRSHAITIARLAGHEEAAPRPKVGPNEPCPCGSGRKHKHCCMK